MFTLLQELRTENENLEIEIKHEENEINGISEEIKSIDKEIEKLEEEMRNESFFSFDTVVQVGLGYIVGSYAGAGAAALRAYLESKKKVKSIKEQIKQLKAERKQISSSYFAAVKEKEKKEVLLKSNNRRIADLKVKIDNLSCSEESIKDQIEKNKLRINEINSTIEQTRKALDVQKRYLQHANQNVKNKEQENAQIKEKERQLSVNIDQKTSEIENLMNEMRPLIEREEQLQTEVQLQKARVDNLKSQYHDQVRRNTNQNVHQRHQMN